MPPAKTLNDFHRWLLDDTPDTVGYLRVIVIHGAAEYPLLAAAVSEYLNEYDDDSKGKWLALAPSLIEAIADDSAQRRLLGVEDPCPKCPPTGPCGLRKVIKALALHGRVVLDSEHAPKATHDLEGIFHVGLATDMKDCHLTINPGKFKARCLAPIIGDIYLEWLHCSFSPHHE